MLSIGDIIRAKREQLGISQERLADGICSVSTLSRIENGHHSSGRATYEALMECLGIDSHLFPSFKSEHEVEAFRLKHKVVREIFNGNYDDVEKLLDRYAKIPNLERVHKQYIQYIRAILFRQKGGSNDEMLIKLENVAKMSMKDYTASSILYQVLFIDEIHILNSLAIAYTKVNRVEDGIELLYALKDYIERKVVDDDRISPLYTTILYNLTKFIGLQGKHKEVINICDIGIKRCIDYGAYLSFAGLLLNKGYALVMLSDKKEARKYLQESYYINQARGEDEECLLIKQFTNEHKIQL
ncbi:MAG: helix-turn-helix domain-containing protein [Oscillospiraceae bacterium]|jgi:transcriptional regulator with XRE-family HTH domain|nr:helix-turn-helix domain-containing protein [Oscillospiraceae bacterium]